MATKSNKSKTSSTRSGSKKSKAIQKKHGALLTIVLIIMGLHGFVSTYIYLTLNTAPEVQRPWIISMMVLHFILNIAAAVLIYFWKKWGIYIYVASTILAVIAGLLAIGIWSIWYMVFPLIILGWLLRTKWSYFS
jgi:hypothetical protein